MERGIKAEQKIASLRIKIFEGVAKPIVDALVKRKEEGPLNVRN